MAICPRCGAEATGNFCSTCGASLKQRACPSCGETPELGARFCNHCGAPLGAAAGAAGSGAAPATSTGRIGGGASRAAREKAGAPAADKQSQTGWWVAGVFFVGMILILALPIIRKEQVPGAGTAPAAGPGAPGTGSPPDLSQMTPREAADRLFNRVAEASEAGDTQQVQQFMPMALQAYDMARPLDLDGLYHIAYLHRIANDYASEAQIAREILEQNPTYLLGLAAAAEAATALGDTATARQQYARFLEVYESEMAKGLEEYRPSPNGHGYALDQARQQAVAATTP